MAGRSLSLRLLGEFSARAGTCPLPLKTRKAKALLACLAMSDAGVEARERLVGLLWSESDEERARASLRQAICELRAGCDNVGFDGIALGKQTLALCPGSFGTDVEEILDALTAGVVHRRLLETARITDSLLEGLDGLDPSFQVWVRTKRQLLQDRLTSALEAMLPPDGHGTEAASVATALLNLDATHEPACRHLIATRCRMGDVGGALKAYKALWDLLSAEYDIEPSRETQDLIVGLRERCG